MSTTAASKIQSVKLKGHQGSVLCLDHNSNEGDIPGSLLSGSEDGTARLWDLRSSPRACTCIIAGDEVTSVAFGPPSLPESSFTVYLSAGTNVLAYDLRGNVNSPVIREATQTLVEAEDDINQIAITEKADKKRDPTIHLAVADDSGVVQVLDGINNSKDRKAYRKRVLQHGEDALVTSCVFRPRSKNLELASGGTDCIVNLWDVSKPKRPISSKKIALDESRAQMCNPPMVHSLAWSPSGRLLASGLGDGTSSVFLIENRSLVEVARLQDPSSDTPCASVHFPSFLPSTSSKQHPTAQDRLLALIRNDAIINLWDLGCTVAGDKATNPSPALANSLDAGAKTDKPIQESLDELSLADQPKLLFKIPHHEKPNWMASSCGAEPQCPSTIFVADTTNEITAYTIPLIG